MSKSLVKSTSVVVSMTLISRVFGFLRDTVTAAVFGAGVEFDAFSAAFKIPNFMRRLFAEGSFSQAFVPVLSDYQKNKTQEEVQQFINAMFGTLSVALTIVTIIGIIVAPGIILLFAPGFAKAGDPRYALAVTMLRITFPYLAFVSLTAFSGAMLNTYSRFWVPAFTPVFLNIAMIVAALWLSPRFINPIIGLAWGVFIAGIIQLLFQWPFLKNLHLLPRPIIRFRDPGVIRVLKLMVPALFGVSVGQVNLLIDTVFVSLLVIGSPSWLYYSDRLMEFPLGVFGVAISTVILPHLSRHHASPEGAFSQTIDWALRAVLIIGIPAAVTMGILAGPMLSTLFQHGTFDGHAVIMASKSLTAFAVGIAPFMLVKVLAAGFYARQDMRTPVRIGVIAMVVNTLLNCILIWPLAHVGIALSTSLAAVVNAGFLFYLLKQRQLYFQREGWMAFGLRIAAANTVLAIVLWIGAGETQTWITNRTLWRVEHLALLFLLAATVYFAALWLFGIRVRHLLVPPAIAKNQPSGP